MMTMAAASVTAARRQTTPGNYTETNAGIMSANATTIRMSTKAVSNNLKGIVK